MGRTKELYEQYWYEKLLEFHQEYQEQLKTQQDDTEHNN